MSQAGIRTTKQIWLSALSFVAVAVIMVSAPAELRAQEATCPCATNGIVQSGFAVCRRAVKRQRGFVAFDIVAPENPGRQCSIGNARAISRSSLLVDSRTGECTAEVTQLNPSNLQEVRSRRVTEPLTTAQVEACEQILIDEANTLDCPTIGECVPG